VCVCVCVCVCARVCVYVCVCACVHTRERKRERQRERTCQTVRAVKETARMNERASGRDGKNGREGERPLFHSLSDAHDTRVTLRAQCKRRRERKRGRVGELVIHMEETARMKERASGRESKNGREGERPLVHSFSDAHDTLMTRASDCARENERLVCMCVCVCEGGVVFVIISGAILGTGWRRPIGCLKLQDALSCRSFSAKEPLIIGLFCGQ